MTDEQYKVTLQQIEVIARFVNSFELDIPGFLERIATADVIGPILDPTLWMRGRKTMYQIERLATATGNFQAIIKELTQERI